MMRSGPLTEVDPRRMLRQELAEPEVLGIMGFGRAIMVANISSCILNTASTLLACRLSTTSSTDQPTGTNQQ